MTRGRRFLPRLWIERELREGDIAPLSAAQTHYLRRVLRLRQGDAARAFDGAGAEHDAIIAATNRKANPAGARADRRTNLSDTGRNWSVRIGAAAESADADFSLVVAQIAGGGARGDWAIEKMCEAGVAVFVPLHRGKPPRDSTLSRWRRIIAAACAQCGRARLMRVAPPRSFAEWIAAGGDDGGHSTSKTTTKLLLTQRADASLQAAIRDQFSAVGVRAAASPQTTARGESSAARGESLTARGESSASSGESLTARGESSAARGAASALRGESSAARDESLTARGESSAARGAAILLLGGEDGFSEAEEDAARAGGFIFASLGARVWRFETAPAVAAALLLSMVESGEEKA